MSLGIEWDVSDFEALSTIMGAFRFPIFVAVMESKYSGGGTVDQAGLEEVVQEIYQTFLLDVIKKVIK